ncbi:prevent-host-death protein [Paramagnetospirillum marisnigri]|uniref:Antitoxin n=1 Tax=Paramagnetospirillum marisnigri TaxID=1285242 RepID=A0A178MQB6_9PROT|nr:type II toxin-antitoxin system prevent-host-death family antitoxin [Paramagnetospirillum marisnigri]OAN51070.1 prevent-host-death protein [Paramagnetospirillum marisnigri]
MPEPRWSLQDAKNSFSAVVDAALHGRPQTVTRHGKPAVVVLSVADFERLTQRHSATTPSFAEHLLALPQDEGDGERLVASARDVEF